MVAAGLSRPSSCVSCQRAEALPGRLVCAECADHIAYTNLTEALRARAAASPQTPAVATRRAEDDSPRQVVEALLTLARAGRGKASLPEAQAAFGLAVAIGGALTEAQVMGLACALATELATDGQVTSTDLTADTITLADGREVDLTAGWPVVLP